MPTKPQHIGRSGLPVVGDLCWEFHHGAARVCRVVWVSPATYGCQNTEAFVAADGTLIEAGALETYPPCAHPIDAFRPLWKYPTPPAFHRGLPLDYVKQQTQQRALKRGLTNLFD